MGLADDPSRVYASMGNYIFTAEALLEAISTDACLLYTSDAADDLLCVDLGGRRIIKKKTPLR